MISNVIRNINTRVSKVCNVLDTMKASCSKTLFTRQYSSEPEDKQNKNVTSIPFNLTEDLPPIPENYGYPGDENVKTLFELKRIRASFKYG